MTNPFIELNNELNLLIDETSEINDLLMLYQENEKQLKESEIRDQKIKDKVKAYLKERHWEDYKDKNTKIHVKLELRKRKSYDNEQLKDMLSEAQLAQITRIISYETLNFITEKNRERLKQIVRKKTN